MSATNSPVLDSNMDLNNTTVNSSDNNSTEQSTQKISKKQQKDMDKAAKKQAKEDAKAAKELAKKEKADAKAAKEQAKKEKADAKAAKEQTKKEKVEEKVPQDLPQESSQDLPQESSQDLPQESSQDLSQESSQDLSQESSQDPPLESSQDLPLESSLPNKFNKFLDFAYFLIKHFEKSGSFSSEHISSMTQLALIFQDQSSQTSFIQSFLDSHKIISADIKRIRKSFSSKSSSLSKHSDFVSQIVQHALHDHNDIPVLTHPFSFQDQHFLIDNLHNLYDPLSHITVGKFDNTNNSISLY